MNPFSDVTQLPDDFDGLVRLFPLPGLVLFPHAMQPLHIFESRYVEMLREALASDQLITMATLIDTSITAVSGDPMVSKTVCIGKIVSHAEVGGDRHNVLLVGVRRAKIRRELETARPFRAAQVDLIDDFYLPSGTNKRTELKRRLLTSFARIIPPKAGSQKSLHDLMAGQMGVGPITDIIAYTLPFASEDKLRLLEMSDVDARAEELIRLIDSGEIQLHGVGEGGHESAPQKHAPLPEGTQFPPPFSLN